MNDFPSSYKISNNDGYTKWPESDLRDTLLDEYEKNKILSQNVSDLQKQLQEAHKRIKELIDRSIVSM